MQLGYEFKSNSSKIWTVIPAQFSCVIFPRYPRFLFRKKTQKGRIPWITISSPLSPIQNSIQIYGFGHLANLFMSRCISNKAMNTYNVWQREVLWLAKDLVVLPPFDLKFQSHTKCISYSDTVPLSQHLRRVAAVRPLVTIITAGRSMNLESDYLQTEKGPCNFLT